MADPFQGINATAEGPEDGRERLKGLISRHLDNLQVPQRHKDTVKYQVGTWVKFWEHFQGKEDQVVEAWAQFWSYRNDGQLQWDIKVVWDADGSDSTNPYPHYGYEVYLNGNRMAGPGHVNFTNHKPRYTRDGEKMHEVRMGDYAHQVWDTSGQFRLDCALRLWACGKDVEIGQYAKSEQEYDRMIWAAPQHWGKFPRPSFGRIA